MVYGHVFRRDSRFPEHFSTRHIERAKPAVYDRRNHFPFVQRDASIHDAAADPRLPDLLVHFRIHAPDFLVSLEVNGIRNAPGRDAVQNTIEHKRRLLLMCLGISLCKRQRNRPSQTQAVDICGIDLFQRAVSLFRPVHAVADPLVSGLTAGFESSIVYLARFLSECDPRTRDIKKARESIQYLCIRNMDCPPSCVASYHTLKHQSPEA
jgi:hypothetical protein